MPLLRAHLHESEHACALHVFAAIEVYMDGDAMPEHRRKQTQTDANRRKQT